MAALVRQGQKQTATALLAGISAMAVTMSKPNSTKRTRNKTSKNKTKQKIDFLLYLKVSTSRMSSSRKITAAEILAERAALRNELGSVPHGTGRGWSSMYWVSCDCPNCRDEYDPTGEESAKYLNGDYTSFFCDQSEIPSFAFSKIAKESLIFSMKPGFYFDTGVQGVRTLDELLKQLTSPLALYPKHILYIGTDCTRDRFFLTKDFTWTRRSWKDGRSVWHSKDETVSFPYDSGNKSLRVALIHRYSSNKID